MTAFKLLLKMNKRNTIPLLFLLSFLCIGPKPFAQAIYRFDLKDAQAYAFEYNYDLIHAYKDIEIAKKEVREYLSTGFPQLSGSIAYNDYLARPTFIIPEGAFGPDSPQQKVQFGTKYNAYGEMILNQLIFDGRYILGVKASKLLVDKTQKQYRKKELDIKQEVSTAYYTILITKANNAILDTTLKAMRKMHTHTQATYEAGFLEDIDVEQLELIVADLEASVITSENQTELAYSYLKFILGLTLNDSIVLTDNLNSIIQEVNYFALLNEDFNYRDNINYRIIKTQEELAVMKLKATKSEYYPSMNAFLTYQAQAQRNEWNFFDPGKIWYPTSILGVELNIPIWSSGNRSSRVQKAQLTLEQVQILDKQLRTGLTIQARQSRTDFHNAYLMYANKKNSLETAEKIYRQTGIKYSEGLSTSMELLQAHNQFLTTESDYMLAILDLLEKKESLEKLLTTE